MQVLAGDREAGLENMGRSVIGVGPGYLTSWILRSGRGSGKQSVFQRGINRFLDGTVTWTGGFWSGVSWLLDGPEQGRCDA